MRKFPGLDALVLAGAFFAAPASVGAANVFEDAIRPQLVGTDFVVSLGTVDVDDDGTSETVSAGGGGVRVIEFGDFNAVGSSSSLFPVPANAISFASGDLNGDGWDDIVTGSTANDFIRVGLNQQNGSFSFTDLTIGWGARSTVRVALGDADGDSDLDVFAASSGNPGLVAVLLNNGAGALTTGTTLTMPGIVTGPIFARDLNADGRADLAAAVVGASVVALNNGSGVLGTPVSITGSGFAAGLVVAHFDNDGLLDVAFSDTSTVLLKVRFGNGDGTFGSEISIPSGGAFNPGISAGDIDNDGLVDLFVQDSVANASGAYENLGSRSFSTTRNSIPNLGSSSGAAMLQDLDGDLDLDLVLAPGNVGFVLALENLGGFTYQSVESILDPFGISIGAGDLDNDSDVDLVGSESTNLDRYLNDASGNFTVASPIGGSGSSNKVIATADVNRDGRLDVLYLETTLDQLGVALNDGASSYTTSIITTVNRPSALRIGDLDGVNGPDLVIPSDDDPLIGIYFNDGTGDFATSITLTHTETFLHAAVFDMDGDGDLDVIGGDDNNAPVIYDNLGSGTFSAPQVLTDDRIHQIAAADLNGDGLGDVISTRNNGGGLAVWMATAPGTYAAPVTYDGVGRAWGLGIVDITGDGFPDVLHTVRDGDAIAYNRNLGDGTFAPYELYVTGGRPWNLVASDLDGDGDPDVAVAAQDGSALLFNSVPKVDSLSVLDGLTLILNFNEPLTGALDDATTYTLSGLGRGTLAANPDSVVVLSGTQVRLVWTSGEMRDGETLSIRSTGNGLVDTAGNSLATIYQVSAAGLGVAPTSSATAPSGTLTQADPDFDVQWSGADAGSGVASVELFYRRNGGPLLSYGTFAASPISFDTSTTGGDGTYEFHTVATDGAGNVETAPGTPDITVVYTQTTAVTGWEQLAD